MKKGENMKNVLILIIYLCGIGATPLSSMASMIVDPNEGGLYSLVFTGGDDVSVIGDQQNEQWYLEQDFSILVSDISMTNLSKVEVWDDYAFSLDYELRLDGIPLKFDFETQIGGNFWGEKMDTLLSMGEHTLSLHIKEGENNGFSLVNILFSSLSSSSIQDIPISTAPVPEPATMLLFGTGLVGLAGVSRKKKK